MKLFTLIFLLTLSFVILITATKKDSVNNYDSLTNEGVTILSEEHLRTSGVTSVPPVKTKIRNLSPSEMNN
jgi:hypothetical protein